MRADVQHLFDQAAEQAERNRADFLKNMTCIKAPFCG